MLHSGSRLSRLSIPSAIRGQVRLVESFGSVPNVRSNMMLRSEKTVRGHCRPAQDTDAVNLVIGLGGNHESVDNLAYKILDGVCA